MKNLIAIIAGLVLAFNVGAQTIIPLSADTAGQIGFTHKVVITGADVKAATAGTTATNVTLRIFPENTASGIASNSIIDRFAVYLDTPFTNSAAPQQTSLGLQFGDAGSANRYVSLLVGPTNTAYLGATNVLRLETSSTNYLTAAFIGTNANGSVALTNLAGGRVSIFFRVVPMKGR